MEEITIKLRRFKDGRPPVSMEFMPDCGENLKDVQAVYFSSFTTTTNLNLTKWALPRKTL